MNGYGFLGGRKIDARLAPMPLAHEITIRARAQSILSRDGRAARLPSYNAALSIIRREEAGERKPRIRVTVPQPLTPVHDHEQPAPTQAIGTGSPMPAVAGQAHDSPSRASAAAGSHSGPCHCGDDAQLHYALIARDLMRCGRENELTDTMRQAYDYEFGGVREPEPIQIPEF